MDIIKAPVVTKAPPANDAMESVVIDDDDDEPYSPGGVSDDSDNFADVTAIVETKSKQPSTLDHESERIRLEMEEINRKIAEEKNEIVGIISKAELKEDEIKSTLPPSLITDISIPSNLSEILASIKGVPPGAETSKTNVEKESAVVSEATPVPVEEDEEEYVPTAPSIYTVYKSGYGYGVGKPPPPGSSKTAGTIPMLFSKHPAGSSGTSKLAKLSEEELLSMVPDDSYLQPAPKKRVETVVDLDSDDSVPPLKKSKWNANEPPPPGLEDEIEND